MDRRISQHERFITHLESRKKPSVSEVHRTLPIADALTKYNIHFDDIKAKHIQLALEELYTGYMAACKNERRVSLMKSVLKHSKEKAMYDQALREVKDFDSLWHNEEKRELASAKWKQWEQRSQADLRDGDIAVLATHLIVLAAFCDKGKHDIPQELSFDVSKIHPSEYLLASHTDRAQQHWMGILRTHYDGNFEGLQGKDALNEFYSRLDSHTQNLIKDAKVFKGVELSQLYDILTGINKERKIGPAFILQCQALYGSSEGPIHAYMSDSDDGIIPPQGKDIPISRYGSVTIQLKKNNIMNRSTVAFDDTFRQYWHYENEITVVPRPMNQVDRKVWPLTKRYPTPKLPDGIKPGAIQTLREQYQERRTNLYNVEHFQNQNPLAVNSLRELDTYAEVQIHGNEGLKPSDIEKVYLPFPSGQQEDEEILRVIPKLDEHKIEWEYRR